MLTNVKIQKEKAKEIIKAIKLTKSIKVKG
jgi:hypothetical protein